VTAPHDALAAPYDDPERFRPAPRLRLPTLRGPGSLTGLRVLWARKRRFLARAAPLLVEAAREPVAGVTVEPAWLLAVLWDELARRDLFEAATDWLAGALGRDPSVGPFQITGATAVEVARFAPWGGPLRGQSARDLAPWLHDVPFAARVAAGRLAQILATWRDAGHDPFTPGGLGPHRVGPLALAGTLYSIGLGSPHGAPRANARGLQIEAFSRVLGAALGDGSLARWSTQR
jgi:hypothetical protein